ncbi:hypothetical protein ASPZODRAFT_160869 [Penicilliopsis zonata CBS 506.65]|uniref:Zn(2)-C6 fungal-type domain-containing protein n=1 Tax=Penicilliopsis zonata CBS 506.65 TaxID=1073090 RepID=A0A1L9SAT2_9EURO|nr:hypothetical protein ASPZODRAFT_160869 [Penicilliopsis zonata CBS 506.65]OJJ44219.1 hypothetical protein ASPZODRAFT_160869 [Penicilliopsis zonata CBS 506.65]
MPPRRPAKLVKTKTFTGCWTCRRRKVKCDNRRPRCQRCGDACEGYNVDLYWIEEGTERPCTVKRKAMVVSDPRLPVRCTTVELEAMLTELDRQVLLVGAGAAGAFSAFPIEEIEEADDDGEECCDEDDDNASGEIQRMEIDDNFNNNNNSSSNDKKTGPLIVNRDMVMPPQLAGSLSMNREVSQLLHNYIHVVADLLQPASHSLNPYRSIYFSRAIASSAGQLVGVQGSPESGATALFHALLAVSAFHLHRQSAGTVPYYEKLGRVHRVRAIESLQKALPCAEENMQDVYTTMSAMLSMASIDIMEGSMTEFWIHLDGCERLRSFMLNVAVPSSEHEQLMGICSFMGTLARSTDPHLPPKPWTWPHQGPITIESLLQSTPFQPSHHSLEFTYGTTTTLASYLHLTIRFAQHIAFYMQNNKNDSNNNFNYDDDNDNKINKMPDGLRRACTVLEDAITNWTVAQEPLASVPKDDYETNALVIRHVVAFHASVAIYFHTLIRPCSPQRLRAYKDTCVANLVAAEKLKATPHASRQWNTMAPIVWPGFIAACEAEPDERPLWRAWWVGVARYCIGSIRTLWTVVQEVWEERDRCKGMVEVPGWRAVLQWRGRRVMSGG